MWVDQHSHVAFEGAYGVGVVVEGVVWCWRWMAVRRLGRLRRRVWCASDRQCPILGNPIKGSAPLLSDNEPLVIALIFTRFDKLAWTSIPS